MTMRWCVYLCLSFIFSSSSAVQPFLKSLVNVYDDCTRTEWSSCLKMKLVAGLDGFREVRDVKILEGVELVGEQQVSDDDPAITEQKLQETLPIQFEARNQILDSLIADKLMNLISKFSLRWKLSNLPSTIMEGRGKKKYGHHHLLMMPLMVGASFVPIALGTLALLAGKALIVGKMALLLVAIVGIRKLISTDDDDHQRAMKRISDYGMKLKTEMMAHQMAYRGYAAPTSAHVDM